MSGTKRLFLALAALLSGIAMALPVFAQAPPKLNVPYRCPNGLTYTILECKPYRADQWCLWREEQNGNLVTNANSAWSSMTGRLQGCTTAAANPVAQAAAPGQGSSDLQMDTPYQCAGGLTFTVFDCERHGPQVYCQVRAEMNGKFIGQLPKLRTETAAQMSACKAGTPFNPPYVAEFPSAYRVVEAMGVGDPRQNVTRSIGAFYQLSEILKVFAGPRASSGFTPDEKKLLDDYSRISTKLAEAAAQKFPGEHFDPSTNPYRFARTDPKFGFEGIPVWVTFLSPNLQSAFARDVGGDNEQYLMAVERQKHAAMQKLQSDVAAAQAQQQEKSMPQDKGSVATRRCLESGRSDMECLGEGMKVGFSELTGGMLPTGPGAAGLRLTGLYSAGNFGVRFMQEQVMLGCGTLMPEELPYSVERSGTRIVVRIPVTPKPLILTWEPDGRLVGPGPIDINGRVQAGGPVASTSTSYEAQTQTTTTQQSISAGEVPQYSADQVHQNGMEYSVDQQTTTTSMVPTHSTHYTIPTVPKTERCTVGALPPSGANVAVSAVLSKTLGTNASKSASLSPGLRLNGTYAASGGLSIEFRDDSATLECSGALSSEAYGVIPESGQLVVRFQHKGGPLSLVLQPNGTLTGSGAVDVAGRKIYRSSGGEVAYSPLNARCSLGSLAPAK